MTRLIAPVGHSRMNVLAAIERCNPQELLLITSSQTKEISEENIKTALNLPELIVNEVTVPNAHNLTEMTKILRQAHSDYPKTGADIVLTSGSTSPISMTCFLLWGPRSISLPPGGLNTELDGNIESHTISPEKLLLMQGLQIRDEVLYDGKFELFPGAEKCIVSPDKGHIEVHWKCPPASNPRDEGIVKSFLFKLSGLGKSWATRFGSKTFHHYVYGPIRFQTRISDYRLFSFIDINEWGEEE